MVEWRSILLPTDFAELSHRAATVAASLTRQYGAELHVVHVVVPALVPLPGAEPGQCTMVPAPGATLAAAQQALAEFVNRTFGDQPGTVKMTVLEGRPEEQIVQYAGEHGIDLIVIGTHARGLVSRIFMGSVSKTILESVACPVLMVPAKEMAHDHPTSSAAQAAPVRANL